MLLKFQTLQTQPEGRGRGEAEGRQQRACLQPAQPITRFPGQSLQKHAICPESHGAGDGLEVSKIPSTWSKSYLQIDVHSIYLCLCFQGITYVPSSMSRVWTLVRERTFILEVTPKFGGSHDVLGKMTAVGGLPSQNADAKILHINFGGLPDPLQLAWGWGLGESHRAKAKNWK